MENQTTINKIIVTNVYRRNEKSKETVVVNVGGAGSSKSHSLCQFYIIKKFIVKRNHKILVLRKTQKSLRLSTYKMFFEILDSIGIYNRDWHNKSNMTYEIPEFKNYMLFTGLDDREKIKSTEWNDIWLEEGNQFSYEDFLFLKTRLFRGEKKDNNKSQMRISLNPIDCWIKQQEGKKDVGFIYSTYKDNPFCNQQAIDILEGLKDEDITYWNIYAKGRWAVAKNIIYNPYIIISGLPDNSKYNEIIFGLDFGFNKPTGLLQVGYRDEGIYLKELLYETHLTNQDRIEKFKELIPPELKKKCEMYADPEDPAAIKEISDAGFNIISANNNVKAGIDFCKRQKYYTIDDNVNLNSEREGYKWKEDKNGNVLDEPVKFRDHLMDPKRYAIYTHFLKRGGDTSKSFGDMIKGIVTAKV